MRDFKVSTVLITLVEENEVIGLATAGRDLPLLPRTQALCSHVIVEESALVVADLRLDARFAGNILTCRYGLRSIAAAPIRHNGQHPIGALCLLDTVPRDFSAREISYLQRLAERAATEIWFCDAVNRPNRVLID
ncbi:GAF domain-containing protein [Hyphomicrobiaceae bacterium 22]|uniref:GAF domain-containing protein n=1 Tax=Prosthecodimorpha staleyi TaxID=2840188 RepID=A0A947D4P0_9HYPH|nr:GAF domain-containing protein [Prosthecodimorpha staleyi]